MYNLDFFFKYLKMLTNLQPKLNNMTCKVYKQPSNAFEFCDVFLFKICLLIIFIIYIFNIYKMFAGFELTI